VDIWEEATLSIERESYTIKCNNDLTIAEKFSASTAVRLMLYLFLSLFLSTALVCEKSGRQQVLIPKSFLWYLSR